MSNKQIPGSSDNEEKYEKRLQITKQHGQISFNNK